MGGQTVQLTVSEAVARVTLHRPEVLNAIDAALAAELRNVFRTLQAREDVRAVILTGAGRAFSAGADLKYLERRLEEGASADHLLDELLGPLNDVIRIIRGMPKIVIAAIHGVASGGGCNLALACDYRLAAAGTRFNQAFVRLGIAPDCGGTFIVPRLIGWGRAFEWMVSGELIEAEEAARWGLIHRVVPEEVLLDEARAFAARIAQGPMQALVTIKHLLMASLTASLDEQLERERQLVGRLAATDDFREGVRAFIEKRSPRFRGG
ncbi:MAG: enoyl-CoA hydratase-related protein [Blastocatellia bacterium]|nr:enoyl-CoA hydratase-related protein [Blastocatellia bacterium]MCS7156104.1 enoyl-CoA hydratase-related protein [Blastocatellia bacterium]MDW8169259.1 enoyl-CoA hydratase-related protein [Acidobacteriota bacterium]MDW8256118.1 enoyl-CoA hydratase-related protein [Acidobacteriota bacterium]